MLSESALIIKRSEVSDHQGRNTGSVHYTSSFPLRRHHIDSKSGWLMRGHRHERLKLFYGYLMVRCDLNNLKVYFLGLQVFSALSPFWTLFQYPNLVK